MEVVFVSLPRTGTTKLAYIIQKCLGIYMGIGIKHNSLRTEPWIMRKTSELIIGTEDVKKEKIDLEYYLNRESTISENVLGQIQTVFEEFSGERVVWGWKDPKVCLTIHVLKYFLKDPRYIIIHRDIPSSVVSYLKMKKDRDNLDWDKDQITERLYRYNASVNEFLKVADKSSVLELDFNDLFKNPITGKESILSLLSFLGFENDKKKLDLCLGHMDFDRVNFTG